MPGDLSEGYLLVRPSLNTQKCHSLPSTLYLFNTVIPSLAPDLLFICLHLIAFLPQIVTLRVAQSCPTLCLFFFFFLICSFFSLSFKSILAALGLTYDSLDLHCGIQALSCSMNAGSSSLTRDHIQALCTGSVASYPLDHQGSPSCHWFLISVHCGQRTYFGMISILLKFFRACFMIQCIVYPGECSICSWKEEYVFCWWWWS